MEQEASEPHRNSQPGNEASQADSLNNTGSTHTTKRLKELENAALQTSLIISRMETETHTGPGDSTGGEGEERPNGVSSFSESDPELRTEEEESEAQEERAEEERRTLTDHLNKRLLSSFLEKLNERDLALPGVQRLDCAVAAEEDSNRAEQDDW